MSNTGDCNTGYRNTGDCNTGNCNTGYCNTGNCNTGYRNTGNCNTGDCNTGYRNTGNCNTGHWNTGYRNTGNCNTGHWNTCNGETGFLNTEQSNTVRVFNTEVSRKEWDDAEKPGFLYFSLTEWVTESEMTEEEKTEHPEAHTTGGYLKSYGYQEAFKNSYFALSEDKRIRQVKLLKELPAFDAKVFEEISGINIDVDATREMTVAEISESLGYDVKVIK